ncbi:MAG TPA: pyridoxamine 5'-phosphate oxidase [Streptosporangiaceae bacterium]
MGVPTNAAEWPSSGLDESTAAADPHEQFDRWMTDVVKAGLPEPTAMVLATVSAAGQPRARTVLLKSHDAGGFTFYTNRTSRKGTDLDEVPRASLLFPWHPIHRQVIVEGTVTPLSQAASEPYFRSRPRASQLAAWASRQSTVIGSRADLDERYLAMEQRWPPGEDVPLPGFWGGYLVSPHVLEFWHGRANRMHDRLRYTRQDSAAHPWLIERLAP